ncbi:MAG: hypothetical protein K9G48_03265 [Reyranella sp.]|nr:hypothetical protein [Reyranella sp.]
MPDPTNSAPEPAPEKDLRAERLAAALRENLKRRKAQARAKEQVKGDAGKESG